MAYHGRIDHSGNVIDTQLEQGQPGSKTRDDVQLVVADEYGNLLSMISFLNYGPRRGKQHESAQALVHTLPRSMLGVRVLQAYQELGVTTRSTFCPIDKLDSLVSDMGNQIAFITSIDPFLRPASSPHPRNESVFDFNAASSSRVGSSKDPKQVKVQTIVPHDRQHADLSEFLATSSDDASVVGESMSDEEVYRLVGDFSPASLGPGGFGARLEDIIARERLGKGKAKSADPWQTALQLFDHREFWSAWINRIRATSEQDNRFKLSKEIQSIHQAVLDGLPRPADHRIAHIRRPRKLLLNKIQKLTLKQRFALICSPRHEVHVADVMLSDHEVDALNHVGTLSHLEKIIAHVRTSFGESYPRTRGSVHFKLVTCLIFQLVCYTYLHDATETTNQSLAMRLSKASLTPAVVQAQSSSGTTSGVPPAEGWLAPDLPRGSAKTMTNAESRAVTQLLQQGRQRASSVNAANATPSGETLLPLRATQQVDGVLGERRLSTLNIAASVQHAQLGHKVSAERLSLLPSPSKSRVSARQTASRETLGDVPASYTTAPSTPQQAQYALIPAPINTPRHPPVSLITAAEQQRRTSLERRPSSKTAHPLLVGERTSASVTKPQTTLAIASAHSSQNNTPLKQQQQQRDYNGHLDHSYQAAKPVDIQPERTKAGSLPPAEVSMAGHSAADTLSYSTQPSTLRVLSTKSARDAARAIKAHPTTFRPIRRTTAPASIAARDAKVASFINSGDF